MKGGRRLRLETSYGCFGIPLKGREAERSGGKDKNWLVYCLGRMKGGRSRVGEECDTSVPFSTIQNLFYFC